MLPQRIWWGNLTLAVAVLSALGRSPTTEAAKAPQGPGLVSADCEADGQPQTLNPKLAQAVLPVRTTRTIPLHALAKMASKDPESASMLLNGAEVEDDGTKEPDAPSTSRRVLVASGALTLAFACGALAVAMVLGKDAPAPARAEQPFIGPLP